MGPGWVFVVVVVFVFYLDIVHTWYSVGHIVGAQKTFVELV